MKRIIDKQTNLFIRDDFTFDESIEIGLDTAPAQGFFWPKWDGAKWIEGRTQDEIDAILAQTEPAEPTLDERVATVETKTVTLEEALEVLFG